MRVLIGSSRSRKEIAKLGIDSHNIAILTDKVLSIVNERKNAELAATDMVKLRLEEQIKNVDCRINQKEKMMKQKSLDWEKFQLEELGEEIDSLKERKKNLEDLKNPMTKVRKTQLGQMIRRTQTKLIRNVRLGMRKKGSGRSLAMDDLDEQFVLNCIETKTTAHGRRQDQVMYTGRRVKKQDFLKLVNYHRLQRVKHPVKSATTVYNRGRPRNKRSIQAKNHLGMGLFCTKKPPKAESNENELTHHQRAHKKISFIIFMPMKGRKVLSLCAKCLSMIKLICVLPLVLVCEGRKMKKFSKHLMKLKQESFLNMTSLSVW